MKKNTLFVIFLFLVNSLLAQENLHLQTFIDRNDTLTIYASDFNFSGEAFADYERPLTVTFDAAQTELFRTFTCEMRGENEVEIWITDANDNQKKHTGRIYISNNYCGEEEPENPPFESACLSGMDIEVNPAGLVELNANTLTLDSSYLTVFEIPIFISFSTDLGDSIQIFTCDQRGTNFVDLWVTDKNGNQDSCRTIINVFSEYGICGDGTQIDFCVRNEEGEFVSGVTTLIRNKDDNNTLLGSPNQCGQINFLYEHVNLIAARKRQNPLNGVTTFDMIKIRQHILGLEQLDSPYKMIAADVNQSGTITTADIIAVRRLILGLDNNFRQNSSWRFVDANYEFPNAINPWEEVFPEVVEINTMWWNFYNANLIAVKIGDVNNSADPEQ